MSKTIKRIILIIGMMLIAIIGCSTKVNALTDGQIDALNNDFNGNSGTMTVTADNSTGNHSLAINKAQNVFCIEGGQNIGYEYKYKVTHIIDIVGNKAIVDNSTETTSDLNLKMAYILNQDDSYNSFDRTNYNNDYHRGYNYYYSAKQRWMWKNFGAFKNQFAKLNDVNYKDYSLNYGGYGLTEMTNGANDYANNYSSNSTVNVKDNTTKENVKLATVKDGNNEYYRVGPYKWDYEGNISSVSVYNTNNKKIDSSNIKYAYYESDKIQIKNSASEGIRDNKNFYILIDKKTNVSGISKIEGKIEKTYKEYTGKIWTLKAVYDGEWPLENYQEIIATDGSSKTSTASVEVTTEVEIPFLGNLRIIKVSNETNAKRLDGAKFIIKKSDTNEYVQSEYNDEGYYKAKRDNNGSMITTNRSDAYVYKTGALKLDDGYIDIKDLDIGKYDIIEIEAPTGYMLPDNKSEYVCEENFEVLSRERFEKSEYLVNQLWSIINPKNVTQTATAEDKYYFLTGKKGGKITKKDDVKAVIEKGGDQKDGLGNNSTVLKALDNSKNSATVQKYIARVYARRNYTIGIIKDKNENHYYPNGTVNNGTILKAYIQACGWIGVAVKNDYAYGDLLIKKVDANNRNKVLNGVGFKIKCTSSKLDTAHNNKYLKVTKGKVQYVDEKNAQVFTTGVDGEKAKDGKIYIKDADSGTYEAVETTVGPNEYYDIEYTSDKPLKLTVEAGASKANGNIHEQIAGNTQEYIDLSGYVWEDMISAKYSTRNALYKTDKLIGNNSEYKDTEDILMNGIQVVLKDDKGNIVKDKNGKEYKAKTGKVKGKDHEGYYKFEKVKIEDLKSYHVEFTYDGLTYQNVTPYIDEPNGSKASEGKARTTFNNKFTEITNNTKIDGKELTYTFENHVSTNTNKGTVGAVISNSDGSKSETVESLGDFPIASTTTNAKFNISKQYKPGTGMTEIENINLGLYRREQPDLALVKDIQNAKVMVNGYEHTYKYDARADGKWDGDGFNVGVKFGKEYGSKPYTRAIYKSDVDFNPRDDKELKVKVTYKIAIKNEATNLTSKVNSIVDYYDSKYTLEKAGTGLDNKGNIINEVKYENDLSYNNNKYKKATITTNTTIDAQKEAYIYVQFSMDKATVAGIMFDANGEEIKDKLLLDNVAEINSYTTYKDSALYAGIDKDSRPGNAIAGNKDSYEDDTDAAPGLQLVVADARKITGSVFLDSTSEKLMTGQERLGDGIYTDSGDKKESGIAGVPVKLIKEDGTTVTGTETTTDENGNFEISGFIPGKYQIVYTWGNKDYPVTDYKSTIRTPDNKTEKEHNGNTWYRENTSTRYSDALDNYETRQKIDKGEDNTTMRATTPTMEFGVELEDEAKSANITKGVDKLEFTIKNVDFGIVERPRQQIDIEKRVSHVKITLANGQVLVDADVDKNKGLTGNAIKGLTYMAPSANTVPANGYLKAEIDNELIQGSTIEITYTITVANNGEVDYDSENYYKYGTDKKNIIKVQPTGVYDYLDNTMSVDTSKPENSNWEIVSKDVYNNTYSEGTIVEKYFNDDSTTETDEEGKTITKYRWEKSEGWYKTLFEEWATSITETRTVRDTKLDNKTILHNNKDLEEELKPGDYKTATLQASKILANTDEIELNNDAEITEVERTTKTGRRVTPSSSTLYDRGETVIVTPPTGENQNYILIIAITISALIILGTGVVFIKKKVLK